MMVRLSAVDLGVVGIYLAGITGFGLRFGRVARRAAAAGAAKEKTLRGYFLADRTVPWWAIALSIVSAETSTLTIIGTPGLAFAGDFGFLQIVLGYMCGRVVVALLFLPKYFRGEMLTAYQLIDRRFSSDGRFGRALYKTTAGLFLMTRAAAEGVRVFAVSIVVGIAIGTGDVLSIAIIAALTLLYTFEGGMAAVIWTDVVQMAIYVGGTMVALWSLGQHVPGGWTTIHAVGAAAGKFHMLNFAMSLTTTYTFWAGVLGGTFLTMASHGTDQLMVQRLLAARNLRESRLALLTSGVVIFAQFAMFLLIGVGLWVFYGARAGGLAEWAGAGMGNRIFPAFIVGEMPRGVAGLLVAAILAAAMSNLSAALNSLSSTTVVDFYMGWRPEAAERERMMVSRGSTVMWALVLFAVAVYAVRAGGKGNVVEIGLSIASVAYGCLLGVFLLGRLTKMATQAGAIVGMVCGFVVNFGLWKWPGVGVIPRVAWTWYVLIGAGVTFLAGLGVSAVWRRRGVRAAVAVVAIGALVTGRMTTQSVAAPPTSQNRDAGHPDSSTPYDFAGVSGAIERAIGEKKLPGAVVVVGHRGRVVFERAYGVRKVAGEPGLDGKPSAAEAMTLDTIFDLASLTKCLVTATAVMQLVEAGKVEVDAPVVRYLPEFGVNGKAGVTVRELLTHYSGLPPDVDLKDAWGLAKPDKAEGIRRAMGVKLESVPGTKFVYSDVNFITLGALVERVSGEELDVYAGRYIFRPLGMDFTQYHPFAKTCWFAQKIGSAIEIDTNPHAGVPRPKCVEGAWAPEGIANDAPTQHDDQGTAETNPDFDHLLRGTVHDPTTRRMGGVAGHAGVFSTAGDVALFAQALLDKLLRNVGPFPLKQTTLRMMVRPEEPVTALGGATIFTQDGTPTTGVALRGFGWDINSAFSRPRGSVFPTVMSAAEAARVQPSFGHTGFTGTSLWIDPVSETYVVMLANSVHPRGGAAISPLRGEVATEAARALEICPFYSTCDVIVVQGSDLPLIATPSTQMVEPSTEVADVRTVVAGKIGNDGDSDSKGSQNDASRGRAKPRVDGKAVEPGAPGSVGEGGSIPDSMGHCRCVENDCCGSVSRDPPVGLPIEDAHLELMVEEAKPERAKVGIDVLEGDGFAELKEMAGRHGGRLRVGLLTNQTGVDAAGRRTIDVLRELSAGNEPTHDDKAVMNGAPDIELVRIFSPEHGLFGAKDSMEIGREVDAASGLPVVSLYGAKESDRRPKPEDLKDLDAVVVDLQDAGVRFYTYETLVGYFVDAATCQVNPEPSIVILDRPEMLGGGSVQGPVSDARPSYVNYYPAPLRHGMTLGELALFFRRDPQACDPRVRDPHSADVHVVKMEGWRRGEFFDETGVRWVNPSPNLRSVEEAVLYPGLGMLDYSNVSVGRGTATPFEVFGAGWMDGKAVAAYLTARKITGVRFEAARFAVAETAEKYPGHGLTVEGVRMTVTDRVALDSPEMGVEILSALHHLYPKEFQLEKAAGLVANSETMDGLRRGDDPRVIAKGWEAGLKAFEARRERYLLYR